jgi:hypothetical protein
MEYLKNETLAKRSGARTVSLDLIGDGRRWHRKGSRLFWRWKSRPQGRPPIPADLQQLIAMMAAANRTWGEERIDRC